MRNRNKLICGVGINDANYDVVKHEKVDNRSKTVWKCPYYKKWKGMLVRCYSKKHQEKCPTYIGCSVYEEWLTFSNFRKWMETQDWEGMHLDKDFLVDGCKVYSPSTCIFIPQKLNSFILASGKTRGQYPLGVMYMKKAKDMVNEYSKPYVSRVSNQTGKMFYLGVYSTPKEAHQIYLIEKLKQCGEYLTEFKNQPLIVKGLTRIYDKIKHHIDNNLELISF